METTPEDVVVTQLVTIIDNMSLKVRGITDCCVPRNAYSPQLYAAVKLSVIILHHLLDF